VRPVWIALLIVAGMLALPSRAAAQCSISVTPVAFGNYNVFTATPLDSTGSVTFQCLLGIGVSVTLSKGTAPTPSFTPRRMKMGAETLSYNLFRDGGHGTIWGDGTGGTQAYTALLVALLPVTLTIYGQIPAGLNVPAGSYSDTVVATIIF
jgi:spore coat protein U-like protein